MPGADMTSLIERIATNREHQAELERLSAAGDDAQTGAFLAKVAQQIFDAAQTGWTEAGRRTKLDQAVAGLAMMAQKARQGGPVRRHARGTTPVRPLLESSRVFQRGTRLLSTDAFLTGIGERPRALRPPTHPR